MSGKTTLSSRGTRPGGRRLERSSDGRSDVGDREQRGSRLTILEACGHFAPEDQPTKIAEPIVQFTKAASSAGS